MSSENPQLAHYTAIHDDYQQHYFDASSNAYRERYIFSPMFKDLHLQGLTVAELACGGGHNALYVKQHYNPALIEGLDISTLACSDFKKNIGHEAYCVDLTKPLPTLPRTYDVVYIIGGLHHCVLNLPQAMKNVATLLKQGGTLIVVEPNKHCFLQSLREIWYKADRYFDALTERALSPEEIAEASNKTLAIIKTHYFGGPAYYFILNSLITRFPKWLKPMIEKIFFIAEDAYATLPGKGPFPAFITTFRRV